MIRSESTKAFGQPSETKEMRGGRFIATVHSMLVRANSASAFSGERSWCRDVLAQIRPEPLFRHQKVRPAPSIHPARPALLGTSSGEIKDFAVRQ
jgi:hypothetical protein